MPKNFGARVNGEGRVTSQEPCLPQALMTGLTIAPSYSAVVGGMVTRAINNAQMIADFATAVGGTASTMCIIDLKNHDNIELGFWGDVLNSDNNIALFWGDEFRKSGDENGARMLWHIGLTVDGLTGAASQVSADLAPDNTRVPIVNYSALNDYSLNTPWTVVGPAAGNAFRLCGDAAGHTKALLLTSTNIGTGANNLRAMYRPF